MSMTLTKDEMIEYLAQVAKTSLEAGKAIMDIYDSDFAIESKEDRSPLTLADKNAHEVIIKSLSKTPFPILSEEGSIVSFAERKNWKRFWMVDPLDGTKEFIKRNGEFTVNIALIEEGEPILGVIYVPVKDDLYFGASELGAYKVNKLSKIEVLAENLLKQENKLPHKEERPYTMVGSRSHMSKETDEFMQELKKEHNEVEILSVGSSLKLCMLAEGRADVYPRFAPTMEWDTAAGQAILQAVGGSLIDWETKNSMVYNRENLRNNWFLAKA